MTSTVTAWASNCDDCSVIKAKTTCCAGADAQATTSSQRTARVTATLPSCCQTASVGDCEGVRYDTQDAATSSVNLDATPAVAQAPMATVDRPRLVAATFVPVPTATPPPIRTTVLLL